MKKGASLNYLNSLITVIILASLAALLYVILKPLTVDDTKVNDPFYICDHLQGVYGNYNVYYPSVVLDMQETLNYHNASNVSIYKSEMWRWTTEGPIKEESGNLLYKGEVTDVTCNLKYVICFNLPSRQNCGTTNFKQIYINKKEWNYWVSSLDRLKETVK